MTGEQFQSSGFSTWEPPDASGSKGKDGSVQLQHGMQSCRFQIFGFHRLHRRRSCSRINKHQWHSNNAAHETTTQLSSQTIIASHGCCTAHQQLSTGLNRAEPSIPLTSTTAHVPWISPSACCGRPCRRVPAGQRRPAPTTRRGHMGSVPGSLPVPRCAREQASSACSGLGEW